MITICWPILSAIFWVTILAATSTALAAASGTIIRIGRSGYPDCAIALEPKNSASAGTNQLSKRISSFLPDNTDYLYGQPAAIPFKQDCSIARALAICANKNKRQAGASIDRPLGRKP